MWDRRPLAVTGLQAPRWMAQTSFPISIRTVASDAVCSLNSCRSSNRLSLVKSRLLSILNSSYSWLSTASYYDDVKPVDAGEQEEGVDPEMVKKVAILLAGVFAVILASVALMMLL